MLMPSVKKWLMLAVLATSIAGTLNLLGQTGGLEGDVKDEKGTYLVGYPVVIEPVGMRGTYKSKTDKHGHYIYIGLKVGEYKITLQDPSGHTLFFFNNKHIGLGDPTVADFDLAKEKAEVAKTQQANPEVQKQVEEQNKEQTKLTGLKQLYEQGNALFDQKKYAEATAMFEQAVPLAKDKNLNAVLGRLGDSYERAGQHDKALETYQKVLAGDPSNAAIHNSMGSVYARMNKIPEAKEEFKKSAELNPTGAAQAYFNLGVVMYNAGKMDEAAEAMKKATSLDASYADAFFYEGLALMGKATMEGDKIVVPPGTTEALQSYLKLQPSGANAPTAQQMLQQIQSQVQTELKVEKKKKKS